MRERDGRILVVDDDAAVVEFLVESLAALGFTAAGETSPRAALARVAAEDFDLVVSDVEMPELRGLELLRELQERRPGQLVVLITAFGSIELAVEAIRAGAYDFVTKPFRIEVLDLVLQRGLRERTMRREIVRLRRQVADGATDGLVARSEVMRQVVDTARRAARSRATVLLTGASGTGKGAVARMIHARGERARRAFVPVNCAALPGALVEAELFGVRRGAYTDAREDRDGLFAEADGGTVFLDEIGEMPLEAQAKLLHALETGQVRPIGGGAPIPVDVRVIAATNAPLEDALQARTFRADLFFRLNVIRIELPPLAARRDDIPELIDLFVQQACARMGRDVAGVSADALAWLVAQPWPGNVRELANVVERAVALTDHDTIVLEDVRHGVTAVAAPAGDVAGAIASAAGATPSLAEVERAYIRQVLAATGGNVAKAARILGIDRRTIYRKLGSSG